MRYSDFCYGIAKISQGLRKFRNGSENFAILVKIRYHNENYCAKRNSNFRYACNFRYDSEIFLS